MTAKEMMELVQQHHPHMKEVEIIKLLDRVKDNFCEETEIYKKSDTIRCVNKVHEKIEGYDTISNLPSLEEFALLHPKDIKKQEKQNEYYDTLV